MNDKVPTRMIAVMSVQYGQKFTSLIQNEDAENAFRQVWGNTLSAIGIQTIKQVLDQLPTEHPEWPPTVGQFLALCKVGKDPTMKPQLPKPAGDPAVAEDAFAQLRQMGAIK